MVVIGLKVGIWGVVDDLGIVVIYYNIVYCKYYLIEMYFGQCNFMDLFKRYVYEKYYLSLFK